MNTEVEKIADDIARAAGDQIIHGHMSAEPFKTERHARAERLSKYAESLRALPQPSATAQEAVAEVARETWCGERTVRWLRSDSDDGNDLLTGTKLYTAPPPQSAPETAQEAVGSDGPIYGIIDPDYGRAYTIIRKIAWEEGYAIGLHGSFTRDLDLIAVPWTEQARNVEHMINRIVLSSGLKNHLPVGEKPHGRRVWTLTFPSGDPRFVDLSVFSIPPQPAAALRSIVEGKAE